VPSSDLDLSRATPESLRLTRTVSICGLPVYSGALLTPESPVFRNLHTPADFVRFAKGLRGQFCILISEGRKTVAITDFGCSRPVFFMPDPATGMYRVSSQLADLVPFSSKRIAKAALFCYILRGGVGITSFYSDIQEVFPASVAIFEGAQFDVLRYLDWRDFLETAPIDPGQAARRFLEIGSEYLGAIAKGRGPIASLLSGGTDSALVTWLLRSIGQTGLSLTADYGWSRYSEFSAAAATADVLGVPHRRIVVNSATRRQAFRDLNSKKQNAPCCTAQVPILHRLAQYAIDNGIDTLATGDHADSLFLGFDRFFRSFPADSHSYAQATEALDPASRIALLCSQHKLRPGISGLLSSFGCQPAECMAWEDTLHAADCRRMMEWVDRAPLHTLQQLSGQAWAGISWQNVFLPVSQAFEGRVEFVSPFYDLEMIRFALSLPLEYKFRDGLTKVLLRDILGKLLGRQSIAKRASPNPARLWRLIPSSAERRDQAPLVRPVYDRLFCRNFLSGGKLWAEMDQTAALGLWLGSQPFDLASPPE
jgi:asparagine synthetase B (glutamine-hydrolysing)